MKVLMISGDKAILEEGSGAHTRLELQRRAVDRIDVFVWPQVHPFREICRTARVGQHDVITAQDPFWRGLIAWRVARKTGTKLNIQLHADLAKQSAAKRCLACFTLRRADSIRVVSEKLAAEVRVLGVVAKVSVLPIYVDLDAFRSVVREPHEWKTILWVGRFEAEKDPIAAIEVLKEVREAGVDAKLVMLGAGSLDREVQRAAKGLLVELPGRQELKPFLARADVVLSTSREESWGASLVEALAAGVPVVAPDVGIAKEAGATVVERVKLASAVTRALKERTRGELRLALPNVAEWAKRWRETLI